MAQRRRQPPRNTQNNSPIAIIAASVVLIVVVALVGWLLFGFKGASDATPTPNGTPVSTAPASATVVAQATVSAVASAGSTPINQTPTSNATPSPAATPRVEPTPTFTPTPTPITGDYGEIPTTDMPSGTAGSRRLQLEYHLNMSLQEIPQTAPVYLLQPRIWTADEAANLAQSLGISGEVQDQGNGSFRASGGGDLYISNSLVQFIGSSSGAATPTAAELPGNDALVQTARNWLIQRNLLGAAIGPGSVINRDDTAQVAQVQFKPVEPASLLSAIPSANVTLGGDGAVREAFIRWPAAMPRSTYGLRSAANLWADASSGRGYVEIDDTTLPSGSGALTGSATVTGTTLAYTTAGDPETNQYLVPLVVFTGQATVQGADAPIPIKIYVPAVGAQAAPRG